MGSCRLGGGDQGRLTKRRRLVADKLRPSSVNLPTPFLRLNVDAVRLQHGDNFLRVRIAAVGELLDAAGQRVELAFGLGGHLQGGVLAGDELVQLVLATREVGQV